MRLSVAAFAVLPALAAAQTRDTIRVDYPPAKCPNCTDWGAPHAPFRIAGGTYYVGTNGISSILITSPQGHVLIDGAVPAAAPVIAANIQALGFRLEDVKIVLNSHAHYDHAGGIAALAKMSGARVFASPWSAKVIRTGDPDVQDPQYGIVLPYPGAGSVTVLRDGQTLRVGPVAITAHFTPGHTPGGTSWTWDACDAGDCVHLLYADSQTAVSAEDFFYTRSKAYTTGEQDFARGLATLEQLPCDVLLTPHPGVAHLFARAANEGAAGKANAFVDPELCKTFIADAKAGVAKRMAGERAKP
jgi:metallo-beta-lactamase class B